MGGLPWYEIDVLAVGDGERSGDAIAMRYSIDGGPWSVLVIDGGNKEAGARLVEHIRREYGTNVVNNALNTHPDADHSSGLTEVLENLDVRALWMHKPWEHVPDIMHAFDDGRLTIRSVGNRIQEALRAACSVHDLAVEKGVPVFEPFQGSVIGGLVVMAPTMLQYQALVPHFRSTPPAAIPSPLGSMPRGIAALAEALATWIPATQWAEDLALGAKPTAAENESSVVLCGNFGGERILFTGDAGPNGLLTAAEFAARCGVSLQGLRLLQTPHHGSRNNLSSAVLRAISASTAFVSVAANSPTHPRRSVTNALQRRGTQVYATKGKTLRFHLNAGERPGWTSAAPVPWYDLIEAS